MGVFRTSRVGMFSVAVITIFGGFLAACTNVPTEPAPVVMGGNSVDVAGPVTVGPDPGASSAVPRATLRQAPGRNHTTRAAHPNRHRVANKERHQAPIANSAHRRNASRVVAHRESARKQAKAAAAKSAAATTKLASHGPATARRPGSPWVSPPRTAHD